MENLEEYVLLGLSKDETVIREIEEGIRSVIDFFVSVDFATEDAETKEGSGLLLWPYWALDPNRKSFPNLTSSTPGPSSGKLSQSATSMIVNALDVTTSGRRDRCASGYKWERRRRSERPLLGIEKHTRNLTERIEFATKQLAIEWNAKKKENPSQRTRSSTFGTNDILSLSWHLDLFAPNSAYNGANPAYNLVYDEAIEIVADRVQKFVGAKSGHQGVVHAFNGTDPNANFLVLDSTYNLLRFVRCLDRLSPHLEKKGKRDVLVSAKDRAFYRLQSRLHDHLSFSTIKDSRFDASELAFCLEGMLQLRRDAINTALFERVLEVLEETQKNTPYWASDMPMLADHKGRTLYPTSAEIARSLLASMSIADLGESHNIAEHAIADRCLSLITRYWQWLKTRKTTIFLTNQKKVSGWHSEHLNDPALIHLWETSQNLEFCVALRDQLLEGVSRRLLTSSRLDVKRLPSASASWAEITDKYEPIIGIEGEQRVYSDIGVNFIEPHQIKGGARPFWSMLLYGPPGTGKTELASNIAIILGIPLVTITVSDFLAEGESRMEMRAKLVFDVLLRQSEAVVLFDEMDQFLLDRDSKLFETQATVFKFLTPGMLTKFHTLRSRSNVIFIIATNYAERIDPAIKRTGRIDKKYLLLPPDSRRRMKILYGFDKIKPHLANLNSVSRKKMLSSSAFLGFTDLRQVANEPWTTFDDFCARLDTAPRNVQFRSYLSRFNKTPKNEINLLEGPREELSSLIRIANEAWGGSKESITRGAERFEFGRSFSSAIRELFEASSTASRDKLKAQINKYEKTIKWD